MKKVSSKTQSMHQKSDSATFDKDSMNSKSFQTKNLNISPLSLNTLASNTTNYMDTGLDTLSQKQSKGQSSGTNYENQYFKLSNEIREMYIEMKNSTIRDDPNCALMLKKSVPLDQDDEAYSNIDAMVLLQYIKKIYDKTREFKNDAEVELSAKKEGECSDYESMLQKLEAEVRQHIRIEQQLKLYVESTQAKLDELEKNYDPSKMEAMKREIESLKNENTAITEKLKRRENDIDHYKKEINNKNSFIKDLEHQVENIPALKNKIRELEKMLNNSGTKPPSSNVLKGSNKNNRENEAPDKNASFSNAYSTVDSKMRKGSQPSLGYQSYELSKQKQLERDKENLETYKLDFSKHMYESLKGYRSNSHSETYKNGDNSRIENSINKSSAKREEKAEDFGSVLEKMKKTLRSHSRNTSKENLRSSDQTINPEEILEHDVRIFESKKSKEDTIDPSRYSYDKKMKSGTYSQTLDRKSWDKPEYKDSKGPHKLNYYKEVLDNENNQRNSIPRPRPSTGNETSYIEYKYKKEQEAYDLNKLKVASPKKMSQDRSQSVDAKQRLQKQTKSRDDIHDKTIEDEGRPSVGAYNTYVTSNASRKIVS